MQCVDEQTKEATTPIASAQVRDPGSLRSGAGGKMNVAFAAQYKEMKSRRMKEEMQQAKCKDGRAASRVTKQ